MTKRRAFPPITNVDDWPEKPTPSSSGTRRSSGQAQRFARWKARNDAALQRDRAAREAAAAGGKPGPVRFRRSSPLRRGPPPGGRLPRFDPDAPRRKNIREVDEILAHANAMAYYALEKPRRDTSRSRGASYPAGLEKQSISTI
jgi:hypothetical protein